MGQSYRVEEVYRTEGIPEYTYVPPPNYSEILVDMRAPGKPVIVEGQSGTGKTTTIRKIIELSLHHAAFEYLSARKAADVVRISSIVDKPGPGHYIIDDFHRLTPELQEAIGNLVKVSAEDAQPELYPKLVIVGINRVGSELIHLVHDVAKRCGIHKIRPADASIGKTLIHYGEDRLNVKFNDVNLVLDESRGDYWLTQTLCQTICISNDVLDTDPSEDPRRLEFSIDDVRLRIVSRLESTYREAVIEFCRGRRFRATNQPYFKLLKAVSEQDSSVVDVTMLANSNADVRGSVNNIKEKRLADLIDSKPICERHFYYNRETKNFAIEDPALFYYMKHLDWSAIQQECGFRGIEKEFLYDVAISFAGENRDLAREIAAQLQQFDVSVFYDEHYEANFLGTAWSKQFPEIFGVQSRYVVVVLDDHYKKKMWTTFEKESFAPRLSEGSVIPIYLDDSVVFGIPQDVVGVKYVYEPGRLDKDDVLDKITVKLIDKLEAD